jgi:hypothetical protein
VDAGNISPEKRCRHAPDSSLHRSAMQVFYCRDASTRQAGSVPARFARRRFIAGPIPAVVFCTGLQYPKVN